MCTAKDERVDPVGKQGLKIPNNNAVGHVIVEQSFLNQRHEQRTRATAYAHTVVRRAESLFVRAASNRRPCSDDADMLVPGCL